MFFVTQLRVRVLRFEGSEVWFESDSENAPFKLRVRVDMMEDLRRFQYADIDVVIKMCRDGGGQIESGEVLSLYPLASRATATISWMKWFEEARHEQKDQCLECGCTPCKCPELYGPGTPWAKERKLDN